MLCGLCVKFCTFPYHENHPAPSTFCSIVRHGMGTTQHPQRNRGKGKRTRRVGPQARPGIAILENLRLKRNLCRPPEIGLPVLKDSGITYTHSAYVFNYNETGGAAQLGGPHHQSRDCGRHHYPYERFSGGYLGENRYRHQKRLLAERLRPRALGSSADFKWSLKALSESYTAQQHDPAAARPQPRTALGRLGRPTARIRGAIQTPAVRGLPPGLRVRAWTASVPTAWPFPSVFLRWRWTIPRSRTRRGFCVTQRVLSNTP